MDGKQSRLLRGATWQIGLNSLNNPKNSNIREFLRKPKFNVKDSNITYRVIHTWTKDGLLSDNRPEGSVSWRRLNFIEVIWIRVLNELRKYGLSKKQLRESYRTAFNYFTKPESASLFEVAVCLVLQKKSITLCIFEDGWLEPMLEDETSINKILNLHGSYIQINLNSLMREVFPNVDKEEVKLPMDISKEEEEVLAILKAQNLTQLSISLKGGQLVSLDKYFEFNNFEDANKFLSKVRFGEIKIKKRHGKFCFYEVIDKENI
ncbi:hypothetical protein QWY77_02800 [Thalassotalea ponticola]|uniref:hypothetical protein n=1 Tax=Thalassotalea ponticola TaxID=1523392 RepID=UPI0025B37CD6|nr:hypothetical protein [Thalassotalea ponticola]MDN3651692.1 hypothetical protein [Thalassotalea ponticola]